MSDGAVRARLDLDSSGFQQGLAKAGASLNAFAGGQLSSIKGTLAGAFTVGAITKLGADAIALGGKFDDLSKRTGVSAESLQALDYAAKQNGSSIEALVGGLQKLAIARQKALEDPNSEPAKAFNDLGISIQQVAALSPEQLFYKIADAVKNDSAATEKAASMTAVLGKSFGELVPMMSEGGAALKTLADEARNLGIVLSESTISALDNLGDSLDRSKMQLTSWGAVALEAFMAVGAIGGAAISNVKGLVDSLNGKNTPEARQFNDAVGAGMFMKEGKAGPKGGGGSSLSTASQSDIDKFREAQRKAAEARMTDEEKLADLQQRSAQKYDEAFTAYMESRADAVKIETEALKLATEAEAIQRSISDEKAKQMESSIKQEMADAAAMEEIKIGKGVSVSAPISDNLARIGGYVGAQGTPALRVAERQEKIQQKMVDYLKKIAERDFSQGTIPDATPR